MMQIYRAFASVYDDCMDEVPYVQWFKYITGFFQRFGVKPSDLVLELGCGTGTMTMLLAEAGYDMIGIDASEDMLNEARDKMYDTGRNDILYLQQDMRSFELFGTVKAVVSVCDTMNYMLTYEDLTAVLKLVNNYLDPGGIFIFDMKTEYYYRECAGNRTYADLWEDMALIWENEYDSQQKRNVYRVSMFLQETENRYIRQDEEHVQRAYSLEELRQAVIESGLQWVGVYDGISHQECTDIFRCERIYIVAQECQKEKEVIENE